MWNTVPTFVYLNIAILPLDSCLSLNPAPSSATSELPLQYDLISVVAFGFTLWAESTGPLFVSSVVLQLLRENKA